VRVHQVDIIKFRGVSSASLPSCGTLNVLIGKNNSGKSTILDAIDAFFQVISADSIVSATESSLGIDTDFHRGSETLEPIEIAITFELDPSELGQIIESIIKEAPQMKNALEDGNDFNHLRIAVSSVKHSRPFAYVSRIELVRPGGSPSGAKILFDIESKTALEILTRRQQLRAAQRRSTELLEISRRIDADDFQVLRREGTGAERPPTSPSAARIRRLYAIGPEMSYELESIIRHAENFAEFRREVDALATAETAAARRSNEEPLTNSLQTFSGEAQAIPGYAPSILALARTLTVLHLRDRRDPVGREEAQKLLSLKTRRKGPEVLRSIQGTVHSLLGVSIDAFESERSTIQDGIRAEMDVDEVLVEMNGAGIREALRLILDTELSAPHLLLVEEPEIHLHPALELSMLRYLKSASDSTQIFLSTHSTNFLDTSEMRNVYLTRREPWVTATLLDYEQAEAAIPEELGLRLSSVFMYDKLVFVEGATDEAILRELASTIGVNFGQNNVGFVAMGSGRNFTHFATQATIDLLARRRVKLSFVLDRDETSGEELTALLDRAESAARVHVLRRREIENYLAVPRALAEFISEKRSLQRATSDDVTEEAVAIQLQKSADDLRQLAVEKRVIRALCSPVYFDRAALEHNVPPTSLADRVDKEIDERITMLTSRKAEIIEEVKRAETQVDEAWERGDKLDLVPGDELLDNVCQAFGVRFKKRRDGSRLASLLWADEVSPELADLLLDLVT
jgi:putative ATP-dependent endonuclease of OLD family